MPEQQFLKTLIFLKRLRNAKDVKKLNDVKAERWTHC